jgi:hypothetical protein
VLGLIALALGLRSLPAYADTVAVAPPGAMAFFEQKVRPLLVTRCYACHAGATARGGLLLDSRIGTLKGGGRGPALVPGQPDNSLLIRAVRYADKSLQMPPAGKLSAAEIGVLVDWVRQGAHDPRVGGAADSHPHGMTLAAGRKHWAFLPLKRVAPPVVAGDTWSRTSVDRFVAQRLQRAGLHPNPIADRRTLIRRATFDLLGLPPTPQEVAAFMQDRSPDAYPKLIDRLLASPHYGERWGRHWLDLARFAESHGYEQDYDRPYAYQYRDFVIRALNADLPYDRFVRWQLAGDELEPDNPLALMATGFLGAGTHATQITKNQVEKERYDELDDMISTTSLTFLGLTMGCARCHDHKYDPIPQRDYYRLLSTFTTTVRSDVDVDMDPASYRQAKATYDREHAPLVAARERYEREELPQSFARWLQSRPTRPHPAVWRILELATYRSQNGATLTPQDDGSVLASGTNPDTDTYVLTAHTQLQGITSIRLEALADPSMVRGGPGRAGNGNFALTDLRITAAPLVDSGGPHVASLPAANGAVIAVPLLNPRATFEQPGLPVSAVIDSDPHSAWAIDPQFGKDHAAVFDTTAPIGFPGGTLLTFTLKFENNAGHNIGRPRLAVSVSPPPVPIVAEALPDRIERLLAVVATSGALSTEDREALLRWYRPHDPEWQRLDRQVHEHLAHAPQPKLEKAMICSEGVAAIRTHTQGGDFLPETHFLKRGDPNQKAGVATQSFLQVLMFDPDAERRWQVAPPQGRHTSYRRTSLANWITDVDQGAGRLLARVIVNRLWQRHIGRGIVATPSDFGTQGDRPTHPELLDWLATELIRDGWRLKPLHRLLMTSAVYMQSATADTARARRDPDNKLIWRHAPQRLEAEALRDSMLAVSGLLDTTLYGAGTLDEAQRRRSIYFFVKRSRLIPMMTLFDAPNALQSIAMRPTTTIAPQALLLLNGERTREIARALAGRVAPSSAPTAVSTPAQQNAATQEQAIRRAYWICLGRSPDRQEIADAVAFLQAQTASYGVVPAATPQSAATLALTDFCQVMLGLNEFIYID